MQNHKMIGAVLGMILALTWIILGFGDMILILLAGLAGYGIATLIGGKNGLQGLKQKLSQLLKSN